MYEISIVTVDRKSEKYKCETMEKVLELFDKLDDNKISTISVKRVERR